MIDQKLFRDNAPPGEMPLDANLLLRDVYGGQKRITMRLWRVWRKTGWSRESYLRYEEKQRIRAGMENAARRYDVAEDYADSSDSSAYSRDCIRTLNDLADERRAEQEAPNTNASEGYR